MSWVESPCERCGFSLEFQLVDVMAQAYRWCPCCGARIHLIDEGGSVSNTVQKMSGLLKRIVR